MAGKKTVFDHVITLLSLEIQRQEQLRGTPDRTSELKAAIRVLRDGQGFLEANEPKRVVFYKDL